MPLDDVFRSDDATVATGPRDDATVGDCDVATRGQVINVGIDESCG